MTMHSELLFLIVIFFNIYYSNTSRSQNRQKHNIVLILTDDQDIELGSLQFMPKLARHIRDEGAIYRYGYSSTPMCCPSRSSLLTGDIFIFTLFFVNHLWNVFDIQLIIIITEVHFIISLWILFIFRPLCPQS